MKKLAKEDENKFLDMTPEQVIFCHPRDKKALGKLLHKYNVGIIVADFVKRGKPLIIGKNRIKEKLKEYGV